LRIFVGVISAAAFTLAMAMGATLLNGPYALIPATFGPSSDAHGANHSLFRRLITDCVTESRAFGTAIKECRDLVLERIAQTPADPMSWLLLVEIDATTNGLSSALVDPWRQVVQTGPNDGATMPGRASFGLRLALAGLLDANEQLQIKNEIVRAGNEGLDLGPLFALYVADERSRALIRSAILEMKPNEQSRNLAGLAEFVRNSAGLVDGLY
jgi:hypothetical protein